MDARTRDALDRWITTEPEPVEDVEPEGTFDVVKCDGKVIRIWARWGDEPSDEGILAIIGEEYRGQEYFAEYSPCWDHDASEGDHEPHEEVIN